MPFYQVKQSCPEHIIPSNELNILWGLIVIVLDQQTAVKINTTDGNGPHSEDVCSCSCSHSSDKEKETRPNYCIALILLRWLSQHTRVDFNER